MSKLLVGIIGPKDLVEKILNQCRPEKMEYIEYKLFIIQKVENTRDIDRRLLAKCDILFFAGQMVYEIYLEDSVSSDEETGPISINIGYDGSALYKSLYELAMENNGMLSLFTPFTIDVLRENEVLNSLKEVDLHMEDFITIDGPSTYTTKDWANIHERYYKNGESVYAVTCLTSVAEELKNRGIPVKRVVPTHSSINVALEMVYAQSDILIKNQLLTTAFLIKWKETDRRPKNRYNFYRQKLKFEEIIIDFCEKHNVSLTFSNEHQANLYTNMFIAKEFTNNFTSFSLIKEIEDKTGNKVFIGIGIGNETSNAELSAEKSLKFAESKNKSCAYVSFQNGDISGPLLTEDQSPLTFSTSFDNELLKEISKKTNLSAVTISRLMFLLQQNNEENLTIHQLAEAFDVSLKSASRLLNQLEQTGFAKVIGKEQPPGRGRPRKIYNLMIPNSFSKDV
ncbi:helix-turn-helix domain-containing protein [Oceanobacillus jeddahense]|uniref:MarR family transcriptional regulator n=1 Tax=Oceanobacillus jeddahense TaxID=1462527 RepID=A0ABY5JWU9_9BACI|nr:hypothetical protein [Oceanobacillus jeddahense]UUI04270.1 hypothetical protein NP439_06305 [Oceanobacillus jeddahense]